MIEDHLLDVRRRSVLVREERVLLFRRRRSSGLKRVFEIVQLLTEVVRTSLNFADDRALTVRSQRIMGRLKALGGFLEVRIRRFKAGA